ncbi:MAG: putative inorganic carbon transporter subunit DabA, partial [Pseudomonadota bacterium]|nr:putative inorganic carbon transporter subunit DabA [Pseudomonadota bacterium]
MSGTPVSMPEQPIPDQAWQQAVREACNLIAPVWPLDQWIAVNPFWGLRTLPAEQADEVLQERGGFSILMPAAYYREAWQEGRIQQQDLAASVAESDERRDPSWYLKWLEHACRQPLQTPVNARANSAGSVLDTFTEAGGMNGPLSQIVCDQVSRVCGAFFDQRQARWSVAGHNGGEHPGLFAFWLNAVRQDLALDFTTGIPGVRAFFKAVPETREQALTEATNAIGLASDELTALCHNLLLRVNGWASWCRGVDWRAELDEHASDRLGELLAVMLVWEAAALRFASAAQKHELQNARNRRSLHHQDRHPLWVWQRALEMGYQRRLFGALSPGLGINSASEPLPAIPDAQAVFCIDVRSEVMRRHLEAVRPR